MITTDRMAAVDANAAALGVPRKQLMESSGSGVARTVKDLAEPGAQVSIVAGRGNNGGDAFVAARFLDGAGPRPASDRDAGRSGRDYDVRVLLLGRAETITTDIARENWDALEMGGYRTEEVRDSSDFDLGNPDLVVDAMLGTGITGDLREPEATAARAMNGSGTTVLSVDVPSGVNADTGEHSTEAVDADHVVTFHDSKPGLESLDGDVRVADIGIPAAAERVVGPGDLAIESAPHSQKGDSGRVFVIGGGPYTGAPALAAQAALRAGADLSFVAVPHGVFEPIAGYAEDPIVQSYDAEKLTSEQVDGLVDTATRHDDIVVLGPGLGTADETLEAVERFLADFAGRAVVDADALSVVADVETDGTLVCTPNRHELAGMGGPDVDSLAEHADGIEAFAADLGHVVLAKGANDVISDGERTRINRAGTPGMTVGGTGDVLAGTTAALLATQEAFDAACVAPYVNGRAAEHLARGDGLFASDLLDALPDAMGAER